MQWLPPNLRGVFLVARRMGTWAMLEVLLLGVFVAYTKLGDLVTIELGPAVYALGLLTIVIVWAETAFDPHAVWEEIERRGQTHAPLPDRAPLDFRPGAVGCEGCGLVCVPAEGDGRCPRCGSAVHERKPDSLVRTWAFVIAAAILYIPANVYPVLTVIQLGAGAAQHHPGRRRGAAGLADVSAGAAGVLRQHPGADVQADRAQRHVAGHPARRSRLGRRHAAARAHAALLHRGLDRPLVDGRHLHGIAAGRAGPVRPRGHHRARHRRRRLLRRRVHHHLRRRSLRSAADVGRRRPQQRTACRPIWRSTQRVPSPNGLDRLPPSTEESAA